MAVSAFKQNTMLLFVLTEDIFLQKTDDKPILFKKCNFGFLSNLDRIALSSVTVVTDNSKKVLIKLESSS